MQEAIECFNKNEFSQAEKMFEKIKSQTSDSAHEYIVLQYLLKIYKKTNSYKILKTQIEISKNCSKSENYKSLIDLYNNEKGLYDKVNFELKFDFLKALYIEGNIEAVRNLVSIYSEYIIEEKVYNLATSFFEFVEVNRLITLKTLFSKLIYHIEIFDELKLINTTNEIEKQIIENWKNLQDKKKSKQKYIEHLLSVLEEVELKSFLIKQKIINLKAKALAIGCEIEMSQTEKIEYVVLNYRNQLNLAFLMSAIKDQFIRIDLKEIVLGISDFDSKSLGIYSKKLQEYFDKKSNVVITNVEIEKESISLDLEGYKEITQSEIESIYKYYLEDTIEKPDVNLEAMSIIKYDKEIEKEPYYLITTFIELELFDAAFALAKKLDESNSKIYICARILFFNKNYLESISLINEKINFSLMSEVESIPYYYLKAESYSKLGKKSEAQNLYSLISTFNPNFRNLKERMF
jgi:hypothetical protein